MLSVHTERCCHPVVKPRNFQLERLWWKGTEPESRIGLSRCAARAEGLNIVSHWWCGCRPQVVDITSPGRGYEPWKNSCHQVSVEFADQRARELDFVGEPGAPEKSITTRDIASSSALRHAIASDADLSR